MWSNMQACSPCKHGLREHSKEGVASAWCRAGHANTWAPQAIKQRRPTTIAGVTHSCTARDPPLYRISPGVPKGYSSTAGSCLTCEGCGGGGGSEGGRVGGNEQDWSLRVMQHGMCITHAPGTQHRPASRSCLKRQLEDATHLQCACGKHGVVLNRHPACDCCGGGGPYSELGHQHPRLMGQA